MTFDNDRNNNVIDSLHSHSRSSGGCLSCPCAISEVLPLNGYPLGITQAIMSPGSLLTCNKLVVCCLLNERNSEEEAKGIISAAIKDIRGLVISHLCHREGLISLLFVRPLYLLLVAAAMAMSLFFLLLNGRKSCVKTLELEVYASENNDILCH